MHARFAESLSIDALAQEAGLSRYYFLRAFTQAFGQTPHAYLSRVRLDNARRSLARGDSVTAACLDAGYSSLGSFSTLVTRRFGLSPRAWQQQTRRLISVPELWPMVWVPACFLRAYAHGNFEEAPGATLW